jgi:hypothetical protein
MHDLKTHKHTRNRCTRVRRSAAISAMATEPDACFGRHHPVIAIIVGIAIAISALRTPWRMLTALERVWAALALCDAILTFAIPSVPATSPWRAVEDRALFTCAAVCVILIGAGVPLVRARTNAHLPVRPLVPAFGVLAVPAFGIVLVSLLWSSARN